MLVIPQCMCVSVVNVFSFCFVLLWFPEAYLLKAVEVDLLRIVKGVGF